MIEIAFPGLIINAKAMTPKSSAVDLKSKVTRYSSTFRPYSEYLKVKRVLFLISQDIAGSLPDKILRFDLIQELAKLFNLVI